MNAAELKAILDSQNKAYEKLLENQRKWMDDKWKAGELNPSTSGGLSTFQAFNKDKDSWETYLLQLEQHFLVNQVGDDDNKKRAFLLSHVGNDTVELSQNLCEGKVTSKTYKDITKLLSEHFISKAHIVVARYNFYKTVMKPQQTYTEWIADLRGAARTCFYICSKDTCKQPFVDELIRDVIILNTPHDTVRATCLQKRNPTLAEVIDIATSYEATKKADAFISGATNLIEVNKMVERKRDTSVASRESQASRRSFFRDNRKSCGECSITHERSQCRYLNSVCFKCRKRGHIKSVCMRGTNRWRSPHRRTIQGRVQYRNQFNRRFSRSSYSDSISPTPNDRNHRVNEVGNIDQVLQTNTLLTQEKNRFFIEVIINNVTLKFQIDTGATCSMIGWESYLQLNKPKYYATTKLLKAYGGNRIPIKGELKVDVNFKNKTIRLPLLIINSNKVTNIMGMVWFYAFNFKINYDNEKIFLVSAITDTYEKELLQNLRELCTNYDKLFNNKLGLCSTYKANIKLKANAQPKYFKARPIPFAQIKLVQHELKRLVADNIIKPIQTSEWAAPIVPIVKADKSIRICADFKVGVNSQIEIDRHPIPRIEELFYKLRGGEYFTKLDLKDAYLQVALTEESKKFLVISTPSGLFEYQRLPFGISSAPGIFQRLMEQLVMDIEYCAVYLDDLIISGKNNKEHINNVKKTFERLSANGFICKLDKCKFAQKEIEYLGHIISKEGVRPSDSNIKAIQEIPQPTNIKEVEAFIGKINYYNKFITNFSQLAAPLNQLRRKNMKFKWTELQERAFQQLKTAIINVSKLVHFNDECPLILATDASSYGVGAVISHIYSDGTEHPIAFASKTLDAAQQNYSQIEKEALSIIYGITKFHQYLYGRRFILYTDHKLLVSLFNPNKNLPVNAINRLQRWAEFLMAYTYDIKYRGTKEHANADALSRLPGGGDVGFDKGESSGHFVNTLNEEIVENFPINAKLIAQCTKEDPILCEVLNYVQKGWPNKLSKESNLYTYFCRRESLNSHNNVILFQAVNARVVIPLVLQEKVLKLLHQGHWGINRMKNLAREHCWWSSIEKDIEKLVANCDICQQQMPLPKQEYSEWPECTQPWQRLHLDFAGPFLGKMWMICVDAYSKFPYTIKMASTNTEATIRALEQIFGIEGLPHTIVTDNGPQFTSADFKQFCTNNTIMHITTSVFHPASNGEAERFVRTFKTSMKKMIADGVDCDTAVVTYLATYRSTPNPKTSPAELLHGRQPRTLLSAMSPKDMIKVNSRNEKAHIAINDKVYARDFTKRGKWAKGIVTEIIGTRMVKVLTNYGEWRRHLNQIRRREANEDIGEKIHFDKYYRHHPEEKKHSLPFQEAEHEGFPREPTSLRRSERNKKKTVRFQF